MPVTPVPEAASEVSAQTRAPQPPPMQPAMKGLKKRRFTPKMAGSVMPIKADRAEGSARPLILASRVLKATASAAPPWAILAALAIGSQ